jgi:hypothetical protein
MTEQRGKALSRIERLTSLLRKGARTAASIQRIAAAGHRLQLPVQLPAHALFAKHDRGLFAGVRSQGRVGGVGFESQIGGAREHANIARLIQRFAATAKAMRATARATDSISNKATSKLPIAMEALARTERSVESGNIARAIVTAPRGLVVTPLENSQLSRRMTAGLDVGRAMPTATRAIDAARAASSIHGVVPPANLSQRTFAEPSGGNRGRDNRSGGAGITINSSPTVVINGRNSGGGDAQRDVLSALRAHREELFDQLRRESARRERAQF